MSPDHVLLLKLYGSRTEDQHKRLREMFEEVRDTPAGALLPEDSYYTLEAVDSRGRRWVAKRLRPKITSTATGHPIAEAQISSLQTMTDIRQSPGGRSLTLYILEDVEIPTNDIVREETSVAGGTKREKGYRRDAWKFRACKIDFLLVRRRPKELEVQADTDIEATSFLRERITEALQFLLGRPVPWSISLEASSGKLVTEIRSRAWLPPNARHRPPLHPNATTSTEDSRKDPYAYYCRRLFERFLRHTLDSKELRHPLWGDLNAIYEASAGRFIDAHALTLTVVIEALLAREFPNLGGPDKGLRKGVAVVRKLIESTNLDSGSRARIKGAMGVLLSKSATSRLRELADRGAVTQLQKRSWRDLRNSITHAYQSSTLSSAELRKLLRVNEVLFTHLIFCAIGYRGLYTDYSSLGFPNCVYPPECP